MELLELGGGGEVGEMAGGVVGGVVRRTASPEVLVVWRGRGEVDGGSGGGDGHLRPCSPAPVAGKKGGKKKVSRSGPEYYGPNEYGLGLERYVGKPIGIRVGMENEVKFG